jgi:hypothetical protein
MPCPLSLALGRFKVDERLQCSMGVSNRKLEFSFAQRAHLPYDFWHIQRLLYCQLVDGSGPIDITQFRFERGPLNPSLTQTGIVLIRQQEAVNNGYTARRAVSSVSYLQELLIECPASVEFPQLYLHLNVVVK